MLKEELSRTDMLTYSIKMEMDIIIQLIMLFHKVKEGNSLLVTLIFLSLPSLVMSWGTHRLTQILCVFGRLSLVILPMELK